MQAVKRPVLLTMQSIKLPAPLTMQAMKLPASPTPPPQDQMILMYMALIYFLSLPLVFVYFLDVTLYSLKKLPMKKTKINDQNDVIYFQKHYTING